MIRQTKGEKIFNIINTIILCALVVIMVYPCLHVLFASLSDSSELMKSGGFLIYPKGFTLNAYLSAFIKEQLGETFLNYVLNLRMELATELLRTTDLSQQDIAVRIGYANSGVFLRVFKKKYGITPGTYRKQNQK